MPNDEILTDDYVAGLLAKDASDCSLKYSAMGLEAFRSDKKPTNMPKPNKRFLRHIIKDTDSHNKALLAKEAAESKARLRDLEHTEEIKRRKTNPNTRDIRQRQMGDIHAILGGKKKRPREDDDTPSNRRDSKKDDSREARASKSSRSDRELFVDRHSERTHRGRLGEDDSRASGDRRRKDERRRAKRNAEEDIGSEEERERRRDRRRRDRSRSPGRRRSQSPKERRRKHRHRSPLDKKGGSSKPAAQKEEEDSDPLDDLIGPAPPPRYRGRGTLGGAASIDRRFSDSYDPKTDVQMDEDEPGDWGDAVEAFRDRQKLKQNQEERMRAAGFASEQIAKVTASGEQKMEEDVRWAKAGEGREWDRGKVVGADGLVDPSEEEL